MCTFLDGAAYRDQSAVGRWRPPAVECGVSMLTQVQLLVAAPAPHWDERAVDQHDPVRDRSGDLRVVGNMCCAAVAARTSGVSVLMARETVDWGTS